MRTCGIHLDYVAMIIGFGACSHIGVIKLGKEIHGSAIRSYCHGFHNVKNALITMYSRCKDLRHADNLFQLIENNNIITWNSMLSGYSQMDQYEEASFLFREMLLSGIEPNYVTIASILPLCA
jgi:pentatricopeptide repeat protein